MQILGRFEGLLGNNNKSMHRFRSVEPAVFRLNSHSTTSYSWSLYFMDKNTSEEIFEDAAHFDIMDHIKLYQF